MLPETNLCDHRQTGITAIEPWRLVLLVCVAKVACMVFTLIVLGCAVRQARILRLFQARVNVRLAALQKFTLCSAW